MVLFLFDNGSVRENVLPATNNSVQTQEKGLPLSKEKLVALSDFLKANHMLGLSLRKTNITALIIHLLRTNSIRGFHAKMARPIKLLALMLILLLPLKSRKPLVTAARLVRNTSDVIGIT